MIVIPFRPYHLRAIDLQRAQENMRPYLVDPEYGEWLATQESYSVFCGERIIACGGLLKMWDGRAQVWSLLGSQTGNSMIPLTRLVRGYLSSLSYRRIEATCDSGFECGHRWLKLLGFTLETPVMKAYRPDGGDEAMYVRLN